MKKNKYEKYIFRNYNSLLSKRKNPNGNREFLHFAGTAIWKAVLAMRFQLGAAGKTGDAKVIEKNRKQCILGL